MTRARPRCPLCGGLMRLTGTQAAAGHVVEWRCVATTCCTGIVSAGQPEDDDDLAGDDYLGAHVEELMRAPVTPQGSGSGSHGRRGEKPGEREARLRVRRALGDPPEPLGPPDPKPGAKGQGRGGRKTTSLSLSEEDQRRLLALQEVYGSQAEVWHQGLLALEAINAARGPGFRASSLVLDKPSSSVQ